MFLKRMVKLYKILLAPAFVRALLRGAAAGTEHQQVLKNMNCDFVVDVGANRGQFALICRKTFPSAQIHSFEPLEEPSRIFKNIFRDDPNVFLYPFAVGRSGGKTTIHVTVDDDSSSLLEVSQTQSDLFPGATEKETRQVDVLPLSQVLNKIPISKRSLLKIDVQGSELSVLQGSEDVLGNFLYLYIECSFVELYRGQALAHQIISWLDQRGFIFAGVYNIYYGNLGEPIQGDFLFVRNQ